MSLVKIFSIYYSKDNLYYGTTLKTNTIEPIQTGKAATGWDLGMLSDDTGDNISIKNPYYGELTCWYWVWKNWLPQHPECEYIGFTQYRRMLNFESNTKTGCWLKTVPKKVMVSLYNKYNDEYLYSAINGYDMVLPLKQYFPKTMGYLFKLQMPATAWRLSKEIIQNMVGEKTLNRYINNYYGYQKNNFIIQRKYFDSLMCWMFGFLTEFERKYYAVSNLQHPYWINDKRIGAYLSELYLGLWVQEYLENNSAKMLEKQLYESRFYKKIFNEQKTLLKATLSVSKKETLSHIQKCDEQV